MSRYRSFTVLVTERYEDDWPSDEAAIGEFADSMQDACDRGLLLCQQFQVVSVVDGTELLDAARGAS